MRKAKEQGADLVAPWLHVQTGTHMGQMGLVCPQLKLRDTMETLLNILNSHNTQFGLLIRGSQHLGLKYSKRYNFAHWPFQRFSMWKRGMSLRGVALSFPGFDASWSWTTTLLLVLVRNSTTSRSRYCRLGICTWNLRWCSFSAAQLKLLYTVVVCCWWWCWWWCCCCYVTCNKQVIIYMQIDLVFNATMIHYVHGGIAPQIQPFSPFFKTGHAGELQPRSELLQGEATLGLGCFYSG